MDRKYRVVMRIVDTLAVLLIVGGIVGLVGIFLYAFRNG